MTIRRTGLLALVAVAATLFGAVSASHAEGPIGLRRTNSPNHTNWVVEGVDGLGSRAYVMPRPVPEWVGHTHITYPPLHPHHHLWRHYDVIRRYNPGYALPANVTRAYYW
jgi:hypothetical protein